METDIIVAGQLRRTSRSRSKTPLPQQHTGSTPDRILRKRQGSAVTSTPIMEDDTSTTSTDLTTFHEATPVPESEPIISSANDNSANVIPKNHRNVGRPKAIVVGQVTNGSTKKTKETVVTTRTTKVSAKNNAAQKSEAAKEKLLREATQTSDYSSDEDDKFRVFRTYKSAGEWWNKYPKTDYTYSPYSTSRMEVAPGVYNRPNMSRQGLSPDRHNDSMRHSSSTTTTTLTSAFVTGRQVNRILAMESYSDDDEVDAPDRAEATRSSSCSTTSTTTSVTTRVAYLFVAAWSLVTTVWRKTVETTYTAFGWEYVAPGSRTPPRQRTDSLWTRLKTWLYLSTAWAHNADTWLLSRVHAGTGNMDETNSRRSTRVFLSVLLALLLLLIVLWWFLWPADDTSSVSLVTVVSESFATFGSYFLPIAWKSRGEYVTPPSFEPLTVHHEEYTTPVTPVDIPLLTSHIIASPTMQSYLSTEREIDINALVARIIATGELQKLIVANRETIDKDAITLAVLTSVQMREFQENYVEVLVARIAASDELKATVTKEVDSEAIIQRVLSSEEFRRWREENRQAVDVDSVAAGVVASGRLDAWLKSNEPHVDGARLVALLAGSAEWRALVEEQRRREENTVARLREELEEKSRLLSEQQQVVEQVLDELSRVREQINRMEAATSTMQQDALSGRESLERDAELLLLQEHQARLATTVSSCCNKTGVEEQVARAVAAMLGVDVTEPAAMERWMANMFVPKQDLEARLANITAQSKQDAAEASKSSAAMLMASIGDRINEQFILQQQRHSIGGSESQDINNNAALSIAQVRAIVTELLTIYDADKTGMVDHALESSGGEVLSTRCTETYHSTAAFTVFGIPLWRKSNNPRSVIQPAMHPGECWAFRGSQGFLVIKLAGLVRVTSFSLEHIPRMLAFGGNIDSAPKDFIVLGLDSLGDAEPFELGRYTYTHNGTSLQHFIVTQTDTRPFSLIELRIESNHGNMEYTCLYRFRVHGTWISN